MNFNRIILICFSLCLLLFNACKKEETSPSNDFIIVSEDLTTLQDFLEANETEITDQIEKGLMAFTTRGFPTLTWTNPKGTYPNVLTIDYGTLGVVSTAGRVRRGKLIIEMTADIRSSGAVRIVRHENFYLDNVKIEGTVNLLNQGPDSLNRNLFLRTVSDRILTFPLGKTIRWNATQIILQLEGNHTPEVKLDDVWSISGTSSGTNRNGNFFSVKTTEALTIKFLCPWFVKGSIVITVDFHSVSINYGDGICNDIVSLTLPDGSKHEIRIRRWW